MNSIYEILERAISDVGQWRWWGEDFPAAFQVEFIGVQLWNSPSKAGTPPSGQVALRFKNPKTVSFISKRSEHDDLPDDWADKLHSDSLAPFTITYDSFVMHDHERILSLLSQATLVSTVFGVHPNEFDFSKSNAMLAFWAGNVGMVIGAETFSLVNQAGVVPNEQIEVKQKEWWQYWREYWSAKKKGNPLPEDYACEVTIPLYDGKSEAETNASSSLYQCTKCGTQHRNKECPTCGTVWGLNEP